MARTLKPDRTSILLKISDNPKFDYLVLGAVENDVALTDEELDQVAGGDDRTVILSTGITAGVIITTRGLADTDLNGRQAQNLTGDQINNFFGGFFGAASPKLF